MKVTLLALFGVGIVSGFSNVVRFRPSVSLKSSVAGVGKCSPSWGRRARSHHKVFILKGQIFDKYGP